MIPPPYPENEAYRLSEVQRYQLFDTLPETDYDNITSLIASICDVPISLITLLDFDRNFLKSRHGVDISESPRNISFCGHAILSDDDVFIVEDARKDERFKDNPIVLEYNTVFYAGAPLVNENGFPLGTLCVYDVKPRKLSEKQIASLILLSKQVVNLFELHLKNMQLIDYQIEQQKRNERLHSFANVVSHDLKSPLANITSLTRLLREENKGNLSPDSVQYLDYIEESSVTLKEYINGILEFYNASELLDVKKQDVVLKDFFTEIRDILTINASQFQFPKKGVVKNINKAALTQIVLNLVDNAFKYSSGDNVLITAKYSEDYIFHRFTIQDNGIGIRKDVQKEIFEMFKTTGVKDRRGKAGTGIGLATVYSLVTKLGGEIWLDSDLDQGSTFTFTIKK
jgi:signal transduction histidine kinase